jgi:hypothetical protein
MKTDWFTKLVLGIIALMLSVISLRPFLQTETVRAQATHQQARQKWEYIFLYRTRDFPRTETNGGMGFVYYDAGEWNYLELEGEGSVPSKVPFNMALTELGKGGWELVAVEPVSSHATSASVGGFSMAGATSGERWVFKRPIQ